MERTPTPPLASPERSESLPESLRQLSLRIQSEITIFWISLVPS